METSEQGLKQSEQSSKKGGNPPPPNVKLQFNVVASTKSGSLTYELKPTDASSGPYLKGSNNQTVTLPNGPDWYDIFFHVVDNDSTQKIVFDTNQPICAQVGTACPTTGSGINTNGQLSVEDSKGKKLTLQNCNQDPPIQIGYTLFFVDESTQKPIDPPFDPIMDNGGGGRISFI